MKTMTMKTVPVGTGIGLKTASSFMMTKHKEVQG